MNVFVVHLYDLHSHTPAIFEHFVFSLANWMHAKRYDWTDWLTKGAFFSLSCRISFFCFCFSLSFLLRLRVVKECVFIVFCRRKRTNDRHKVASYEVRHLFGKHIWLILHIIAFWWWQRLIESILTILCIQISKFQTSPEFIKKRDRESEQQQQQKI